ncbi:MAG: hypothetical protein STHCBS139747_007966, partial [Sporothrix thermara]
MGFMRTTVLTGLLGTSTAAAYLAARNPVISPLPPNDPVWSSKVYKKQNPSRNPTTQDICVKRLPISKIKPELLKKDGDLALEFCRGVWELELSGEVIGAGSRAPPEVRDIGTHVVAFQTIPAFALGRGVLAEYVRVPGTQVSPLQPSVDLVQASGIVGAGCTALKLLRESGVQSGQRILLNGASGSVGSVLVQLCKLRGV